jgi:hypothetical protein
LPSTHTHHAGHSIPAQVMALPPSPYLPGPQVMSVGVTAFPALHLHGKGAAYHRRYDCPERHISGQLLVRSPEGNSVSCGLPGAVLGEHDEDFEEVLAMLGGGGEIAADRAKLLATPRRRPPTAQSAQPAAPPKQQAPHRTDHNQPAHHEHPTKTIKTYKRPDQSPMSQPVRGQCYPLSSNRSTRK